MTDHDAAVEREVFRASLYHFVWKAFEELNPGQDFIPAWHVDAMSAALERVAAGAERRLIITVPPRHLKSITTAVGTAAWMLGRNPSLKILVASYGNELALKHARDFRRLVESELYREVFPNLQLERVTDSEVTTTQGGFRKAVTVGGPVTGFGADLIIIDDPMKAADAQSQAERDNVRNYYEQTLYSRLNDKEHGRIVLIQQRLHADDLAGYLIEGGRFRHLNLPAFATADEVIPLTFGHEKTRRFGEVLFPQRESREVLERTRAEIGSFAFSSQYQQEPVPPGGNIINRDHIRFYHEPPAAFDMIIVSWDTASTLSERSDWSVGTVWGAKGLDYYLLDVVRDRQEVPDLRRTILALSRRWCAGQTIIEDTELGRAITQDLRRAGELSVITRRSRQDKVTRMQVQAARFEAGQVHVPSAAPWLAEWVRELLAFPNGRHDDQVDSTSQALDYLSTRIFANECNRAPRQRPMGRPRPIGAPRPSGRIVTHLNPMRTWQNDR